MDIRVEKTRKKLQTGLRNMLIGHRIEDITVSELCRVSGVNRSTFYVYYDTVMDLLKEQVDLILDEMKARLGQETNVTPAVFYHVYLNTARENPEIFMAIHECDIDHFAIQGFTDIASAWLRSSAFDGFLQDRLLLTFWYSGYFGLIRAWLKNGCRESNEEIIATLEKVGQATNHALK